MTDYRYIQIQELEKQIEETQALLEDPSMAELAQEEINELEKQKKEIEDSINTSNEKTEENYDSRNILLELSGAAGGDEAKLWAGELLNMYIRAAQKKGFQVEQLEPDVIKISGNGGAFGAFKHEAGVHRVQRIPTTEKRSRVHTSTATVSILPELEDIDLHISPDDIEFEAFRSGGHGGQNVNKVSTAVRIRHKPSGIVVSAQTQRYQGQNREFAMKLLKAKLWAIKEEDRKKEEAKLKGGYKTPGWGNQIRSYVLHPYRMVKDLRTGAETGNTDAVLNGELDQFIEEELRVL